MTTRTPVDDRRLHTAVAASVVVVLAGCVAQLVDYALGLGLPVLDSSSDGGAFGVVGDAVALAAAGSAWLLLTRIRPVRPAAVALPPLLTFLALDKAVRLHDHVPHYLALYTPVLVAAFGCLVAVIRRLAPSLARLVAIGAVLLAVSFGLHLVGEQVLAALGLEHAGWAWQVKAVIKHGCEVQGWFLVAIGLTFQAIRRLPLLSSGERRGQLDR